MKCTKTSILIHGLTIPALFFLLSLLHISKVEKYVKSDSYPVV
ncbi:unnamed protein product [Acanthoscelides obtectus]|uniref:Uncharacterized protein n=1 Tax=Acanthoscelides obtectus TaxID=200917 RepID=A0A9P0L7S2_ACAOB|nr:unnamed protein product [Acanthoscelides obtectus]CAK1621803.1 hypothetical protein AOBTE_LOCUS1139 [Acanthoscelides obtectus]